MIMPQNLLMSTVYRLPIGIVCLVVALVFPLGAGPVLAQSGLRVVTMPVPEYAFGQPPTFTVNLAGDSPIIAVTLNLRTPDLAWTISDTARFTVGTQVSATYTLQPGKRQLQAFSPVEYWWEVRDEAGNFLESPHQTFTYSDNRFQWQSLNEGLITVWWHTGDRAFGRTALDIATNGLMQANRDIRAPLPAKVDLYLYASESEAQLALSTTDRLWADGNANPAFGVIVVSVPPDDIETITRMGREIPHELTHLLVYQALGDMSRYAAMPNWLNEGLAVMNQSSPDPEAAATLSRARETGQLLSLAALCAPFPSDPAQAQLAYAQSESIVRYVRDMSGSRAISNLLQAYRDGQTCESGVQTALGFSMTELEQRWQEDTISGTPTQSGEQPWLAWIVIGAVMVIIAPIMFSMVIHRPRPVTRVV